MLLPLNYALKNILNSCISKIILYLSQEKERKKLPFSVIRQHSWLEINTHKIHTVLKYYNTLNLEKEEFGLCFWSSTKENHRNMDVSHQSKLHWLHLIKKYCQLSSWNWDIFFCEYNEHRAYRVVCRWVYKAMMATMHSGDNNHIRNYKACYKMLKVIFDWS